MTPWNTKRGHMALKAIHRKCWCEYEVDVVPLGGDWLARTRDEARKWLDRRKQAVFKTYFGERYVWALFYWTQSPPKTPKCAVRELLGPQSYDAALVAAILMAKESER